MCPIMYRLVRRDWDRTQLTLRSLCILETQVMEPKLQATLKSYLGILMLTEPSDES